MKKGVVKEAYQTPVENLFKQFNSSQEKGLSSSQAEKLLEENGKNVISKKRTLRPFKILFSQFNSFLIYILIIAAVISFLINHLVDGIVISVIVLLNAGIGFFQQYKAEKSINELKKLIVSKSKVIRDGKLIGINSEDVVPGDVLVLNSGDKINADARIFESENLRTNEAILTGESFPVEKFSEILKSKVGLAKQKNMLFAGTQIVNGSAKALVVGTGMQTQFGKIAESLQEIETQKTPMQKRLDKFSKQVGFIILGFVAVVMILGVTEHFDLVEMFLTSVALAVSAIPEGLPAVLTISFAISSIMMSKGNVIIRRLPAVESLGSVTVICTDKTGTLTEEKMEIQKVFSGNDFYTKKNEKLFLKNKRIGFKKNSDLYKLFKTSILCNNARYEISDSSEEVSFVGDPTESALVENALDFDLDKKIMIEKNPSIKKFEFDSKRKMMSVLRSSESGGINTLYTKGAIEKVLEVCSSELVKGQIKNLTGKRKKEIIEQSRKMEKEALRVLGFAYKNFSEKSKVVEEGLIFQGLMGMIDPPRPEVKDAIANCRSAGIKVKMITGDSAHTALAIAKQIGIEGEIVTEHELEKMSDGELLNRIDNIAIFARATPHQKLRITKILQEKENVVAITGDGVNDALALKSADVGIAMGVRGTDVARDVSDIVLIDDNFASLVEGVKQGRKTYDNIKKFTKYFLAVNFSEIILVLVALFFRWPLPLLPLQILWMNLITDSFPALSLVFEKGENVMKTSPRKEKSILDNIWRFVIFAGVVAFAVEIILFLIFLNDLPIEEVRTMVLTGAILFELFFVYTCRSDNFILNKKFFSNRWLNIAVIFSIAVHLVLLYTPLGSYFGVVPLTVHDWLFVLPFALSGLVIFEIGKIVRTKFGKQKI